jgi:hypothetical protein
MNSLFESPKDISSFLSFSYRRIDFFTKCIAVLHLVYFSLYLLKNHYDIHKFLQNVAKLKKNARDINQQCPICMETITDEVKLVCYHSFCARCIFDISNSKNNVIKCPCCRKNSILFIIRFKLNTSNKFFYKFFKIQNKNTLKTFRTCACLCYNNLRENSKNISFPRRRCLMLDFIIDLLIWFLPNIEERDILIMTGIIVFYMTLNILLMISLYLLTRRRLEMERYNVFINL